MVANLVSFSQFSTILAFFFTILGSSVAAQTPSTGWKKIGEQGIFSFVVVGGTSANDQEIYRLAIGKICRTRPICQIVFWQDEKLAARKLPMTDQQLKSRTALWQFNANSGLRRLIWSCELFKRTDRSDCL
jgi:hypothetical protein